MYLPMSFTACINASALSMTSNAIISNNVYAAIIAILLVISPPIMTCYMQKGWKIENAQLAEGGEAENVTRIEEMEESKTLDQTAQDNMSNNDDISVVEKASKSE